VDHERLQPASAWMLHQHRHSSMGRALHHQTGAVAGGKLPICSTSLLQSKKSLLFQFALSIVVLPEDHEKKQLGPGGRKHRENVCFEMLPHSINCYLWKWKCLHGSV